MSEQKKDQQDILKEAEEMTAKIVSLEGQLATANTSLLTMTSERDQLKAQLADAQKGNETNLALLTERTKERDALAAENTALKAKEQDLAKRTAAEVARLGISAKANEVKQPSAEELAKMTATEKCQAAKSGVAV